MMVAQRREQITQKTLFGECPRGMQHGPVELVCDVLAFINLSWHLILQLTERPEPFATTAHANSRLRFIGSISLRATRRVQRWPLS